VVALPLTRIPFLSRLLGAIVAPLDRQYSLNLVVSLSPQFFHSQTSRQFCRCCCFSSVRSYLPRWLFLFPFDSFRGAQSGKMR
jgi:hypothetical protein